jgi:hypothetical protein
MIIMIVVRGKWTTRFIFIFHNTQSTSTPHDNRITPNNSGNGLDACDCCPGTKAQGKQPFETKSSLTRLNQVSSGSLHMQNKFGKDAANPSSGSNWSARRMLFVAGVYFLVGAVVGSNCLWMIVALRTGMAIPLMPFFSVVLIEFVLSLITVKHLSDLSVMAGIFQDKKSRTLRAVYFLLGAIVGSDCLWIIFCAA